MANVRNTIGIIDRSGDVEFFVHRIGSRSMNTLCEKKRERLVNSHSQVRLELYNTESLFFLRICHKIHSTIHYTDTGIPRILKSDRHNECLTWSHEDILDELHADTLDSTIGNVEIGGRVNIVQSCREIHREDCICSRGIFLQCWNCSCTGIETIIWVKITPSGKTRESSCLESICC